MTEPGEDLLTRIDSGGVLPKKKSQSNHSGQDKADMAEKEGHKPG